MGHPGMSRFVQLLAVVLSVGVIAPSALGQAAGQRDGLAAKFQLAEAYLRAGQFERAVVLLEDLHRTEPGSFAFYDKLRDAYVSLKRYDDAIGLVDDQMASLGRIPSLLSERAGLLYQKGEEQAAFDGWNEALQGAPADQNAYRSVYFSMSTNRLFDRAIEVLERGRRVLGDDSLFRADLSYLFGVLGRHDLAMQEYVGMILDNPTQLAFVKRRLARLSEQDSMPASSLPVLERAVRRDPLNRPLRELAGWLYMEAGAYHRALESYRAIDRLENEQGLVLFAFAQEAANAEAFDAALQAYDEILSRYPDGPSASSALFGMAEMHEKQGQLEGERAFDASGNRVPAPHFDAAMERYRDFVGRYRNDPRYPMALQRLGALEQQVFFDLGAAESVLSEVMRRFAETDAASRARFNLGEIALQRGDLIEARLTFSRLQEELEIGELAERARFEMALIDTYSGRFESALALVSALDANTSTDIANDAIALKVLLRENKGPDSLNVPLALYARAQLLQRQRRSAEALHVLDSLLAAYPTHALADEVHFARAEAFRDLGALNEAVEAFLKMRDLFPASYLVDRSLFQAAEIFERDLRNAPAALQAYQNILVDYPGSLLAPQVRTRIRRLRGDGI